MRGRRPTAQWCTPAFRAADFVQRSSPVLSSACRQLCGLARGRHLCLPCHLARVSSKACVTALVCCWTRANKPFIPPEETRWQALGRQLPRGKGHAQAQEKSVAELGIRPPTSRVSPSLYSAECFIVLFFSFLLTFRVALPTAEVTHGFSFSVCPYLPFKAHYSLPCLASLFYRIAILAMEGLWKLLKYYYSFIALRNTYYLKSKRLYLGAGT